MDTWGMTRPNLKDAQAIAESELCLEELDQRPKIFRRSELAGGCVAFSVVRLPVCTLFLRVVPELVDTREPDPLTGDVILGVPHVSLGIGLHFAEISGVV